MNVKLFIVQDTQLNMYVCMANQPRPFKGV